MLDFILRFFGLSIADKDRIKFLSERVAFLEQSERELASALAQIKCTLDDSEAKVAELTNTVEDFRSVNKNLQGNVATYRAERDKSNARVDAAIKALQA